MKKLLCAIGLLTLLVGCQHKPKVKPVPVAHWTSADRWGEFPVGDYVIRNDIWGAGYGPQAIWAVDHREWGVCAEHPDTGGIKAYPHVGRMVGSRLSSMQKINSRFKVTVPAAGSYNTAYDVWCEKHAYEIMLWVNWAGKMGPITTRYENGQPIPDVANVTVGGHTWNVFIGHNGANEVFSFLRTQPAVEGEVDVKAILEWIRARGWFAKHGDDVMLDEVQFGWEITSSPGGLDFAVEDFSVTVE